MRALVAIALVTGGCIKQAAYQCASASQCVRDGMQGTCEPVGYCAFPDSACASGERFGNYSGGYSNQCVGDGDGGVPDARRDGHLIDGQLPDGLGCPGTYVALPGVPDHLYFKNPTAAPWTNHKTGCAGEGANVYLTIPNDMTELAAVLTFAGADTWIGISDINVEGVYVTVLTTTPPYLPWGSGEPDNAGNQDCVDAIMSTTKIATQQCSGNHIAVCECEP